MSCLLESMRTSVGDRWSTLRGCRGGRREHGGWRRRLSVKCLRYSKVGQLYFRRPQSFLDGSIVSPRYRDALSRSYH